MFHLGLGHISVDSGSVIAFQSAADLSVVVGEKISITLIDTVSGKEKAQACEIAWLRQLITTTNRFHGCARGLRGLIRSTCPELPSVQPQFTPTDPPLTSHLPPYGCPVRDATL